MVMAALALRVFRAEDAAGEGDIGDETIIGLTAEIDGSVAAYAGIRHITGCNCAFFRVCDERVRDRSTDRGRSAAHDALHAARSGLNALTAALMRSEAERARSCVRIVSNGDDLPKVPKLGLGRSRPYKEAPTVF